MIAVPSPMPCPNCGFYAYYTATNTSACCESHDDGEIRLYYAPTPSPTADKEAGKPPPFTPPEQPRFPRQAPRANLSYAKRANRTLWAAQ